MKKSKRIGHRILLGSLLFGMFFGAGNLIFPITLGQNAGNNVNVAAFGFIITGVGLASLAAVYCAKSGGTSLESMLQPYGKTYALIFTILLLLTIGPLFALPRTATVPYEVGVKTLLPNINHTFGLFLYSFVFFVLSMFMALKPNKLKEIIGKYINPIFLVCLLIIFIVFFTKGMGDYGVIEPSADYANNAFLSGFSFGYQTMDVLAALSFSFVVIATNDFDKEHASEKDKMYDVIFAGIFAGVLMSIIYYILARMGASSRNLFEVSENGGVALGQIFNHYFGQTGTLFLSVTITLACLKTSTGLIVACSQYFIKHFKSMTYEKLVVIFSVLGFVISNIGLNAIITYAVPVLNFIYPLSIMHIIMGLIYDGKSKVINMSVLSFTFVAACLELIKSFPNFVSKISVLSEVIHWYSTDLTFSSIGASWIMFSVVGIAFGVFIQLGLNKRNNS